MRRAALVMIGLLLLSGTAVAGKDSDACLNYIFSGDYQRAVESCQEAVRTSPKEVAGHLNLGIAYGRLGLSRNALASLTKK